MTEAAGPPPNTPRVVVVGSINMDLTTTTARLPAPGETLLGESFSARPGGKGANQAVAAAQAGATVDFVGAVGSDTFAGDLRRCLADADVGIERLRAVNGPSGIAAITVDENGQNTIVVTAGANTKIVDLDADDLATIASADILLCQLEIPLETVTAAARHAHANGTIVMLNPSPMRDLPVDLLESVDVLVVNESEAGALGSSADRVPHVVTTRGADGAEHRGPDGRLRHAPSPTVDVVDTTGAGDAFTGALAVAWHLGPDKALECACSAGARATTRAGAGTAPHEWNVRPI